MSIASATGWPPVTAASAAVAHARQPVASMTAKSVMAPATMDSGVSASRAPPTTAAASTDAGLPR